MLDFCIGIKLVFLFGSDSEKLGIVRVYVDEIYFFYLLVDYNVSIKYYDFFGI